MAAVAAPSAPQPRPVDLLVSPVAAYADSIAMRMLAAGIPLTLLLDLAEAFGPPSAEILVEEGPGTPWF